MRLQRCVRSMNEAECKGLEEWIAKPSSTEFAEHAVAKRLSERQREIRQLVNQDKARLISMLELSLALAREKDMG